MDESSVAGQKLTETMINSTATQAVNGKLLAVAPMMDGNDNTKKSIS